MKRQTVEGWTQSRIVDFDIFQYPLIYSIMKHWKYTDEDNMCEKCGFKTCSLGKFVRHKKHCVTEPEKNKSPSNCRKRKSEAETMPITHKRSRMALKEEPTSVPCASPSATTVHSMTPSGKLGSTLVEKCSSRPTRKVSKNPPQKKKHVIPKYSCDECPFTTNKKEHLWKHQTFHVEKEGAIKYRSCSFWTSDKRFLMRQNNLHESVTLLRFRLVKDDLVPGSSRRCVFDETYHRDDVLSQQCGRVLRCIYCTFKVANVTLMKQHCITHVNFTDAAKTNLFTTGVDCPDNHVNGILPNSSNPTKEWELREQYNHNSFQVRDDDMKFQFVKSLGLQKMNK